MKTSLKIILCLLSVVRAEALTYQVTTAAEFNALPTLNTGDRVILRDGDYGALDKTLTSSIPNDATALANPILVCAQTPGGVRITAPSRIILSGRGITLAGLDFIATSGMIDSGSTDYLIRMAPNSRYMVLNNIRIKDCAGGDTNNGWWVLVNGFNHRIEYCSFEGKDAILNATIAVYPSSEEPEDASIPRNHLIRRCWFGPREIVPGGNGYETIRIGASSYQAYSMHTTVEENVFYRTLWRDDGQTGEAEIISNKSADNIFRNNTFLESQGQLTLRHGDRALVEGNFFLGGGRYSGSSIVIAATNELQSGVRIIGEDHVVRNNYFENLRGTNYRAALCLMAGEATWDDATDFGYETPHNAQILHNTFINCRQIRLGLVSSSTQEPTMPTNCIFLNNAWQGYGSPEAIDRTADFEVGDSGGNYIYEPDGNFGWLGLTNGTYTSTLSPLINDSFENYRIPTTGSPLLDAAVGTVVADDVRGLSRSGAVPDIGCFEREISGTGYRPLLRSEIGPLFDGGPTGTYPVIQVSSSLVFDDFEADVVGQKPTIAQVIRPYTIGTNVFNKVVDTANTAGSGNGAHLYDDNSGSGAAMEYNFVGGTAQQLSAVRADFNFFCLDSSGLGDDYMTVAFGEYATGWTLSANARRFTLARLYNDGTIDFTSTSGTSKTGIDVSTGSHALSIFVNDYDAQSVSYNGLDGSYHVLAANSVDYWLDGVLIHSTLMDLGDSTAGGTVGTTEDNLGKFGFSTGSSDLGLSYVVDDILVTSNLLIDTYAEWLELYPALGSSTNKLDDPDLDGMQNLAEYALGGNPTFSDADVFQPKYNEDATGSWLNYVYNRRLDDPVLFYEVKAGSDLLNGLSGNAEAAGTTDLGNGFESVTNRISTATDSVGFMQLRVELQQ